MAILLLLGALAMFIPTFVANPEWWWSSITLAMALVNAFMIARLAHRSGLTRMPSTVPAFIYLITVGANMSLHTLWEGQLVLMILLLVLLLMQRTYDQEDVCEESFLATILLVLVSFFWTDMLLFIVIWILMLAVEENLSVRAIGAMIVALALAVIYYLVAQRQGWLLPDWTNFTQRQLMTLDWSPAQIVEIALSGFTFYFILASFLRINRDNISVQKYLQMITLLLLPLLFCYIYPMQGSFVSAFIPAIVAMAASVYFLSTTTLARGIVFSVYVVGIICEFIINLFVLN